MVYKNEHSNRLQKFHGKFFCKTVIFIVVINMKSATWAMSRSFWHSRISQRWFYSNWDFKIFFRTICLISWLKLLVDPTCLQLYYRTSSELEVNADLYFRKKSWHARQAWEMYSICLIKLCTLPNKPLPVQSKQ